MKKYYKHSFTDDKGRKVYEASDGERLINTDIKDDRISKNTIAMIKEDGKTLRRLSYANNVSSVYKTASGDIAIIFKEWEMKKRKSVYWKAELLIKAIIKTAAYLAAIGWILGGWWLLYLVLSR